MLNQKLLFVTGKGGTGKTFLASILACTLSSEGKKVLLIDSESSGDIARHFEHEPLGYEPVEVARNIYAMQSNTDDALAEYLKLYAKIPTWAKITPLARLIDLVSHAAPGVREILVTGKICFEVKKMDDGLSDFDVVIVDAPSTGHVISLLDAPAALAELVSRGMIQSQSQWMQDILHDHDKTGVVIATLSDDVVVAETHDLIDLITQDTQVAISSVILNKDITHNFDEKVKLPKFPKTLADLEEFYTFKIQSARNAYSEFAGYNFYSFPFVSDPIPSLRTVMKYAQELTLIEGSK